MGAIDRRLNVMEMKCVRSNMYGSSEKSGLVQ